MRSGMPHLHNHENEIKKETTTQGLDFRSKAGVEKTDDQEMGPQQRLGQEQPSNPMKPYAFLALMVAVAAFIGTIAVIETPRKPKKKGETIYVLPLTEEMYENPTPLQF